jgi:hypothetical protein
VRFLIPLLLATAPACSGAQVVRRDSLTAYVYTRPRLFHAVTDVPAALGATARDALRPQHAGAWLAVAGSTVALIAADEQVLAETRRLARRVDLPQNHPSVNLRLGPFKQPFPTTIGSGLYFLGDGMTSVFLASGFALRGSIADDTRARRTASEVMEALLVSGTITQVLKHVAGRQTPSEATAPRGLASTLATLTVVALNYPEHKFIWPVSSVAMGALSFAMVNNGVHWASDYPLALAIGSVVGNVVATRGRTIVRLTPASPNSRPLPTPHDRFTVTPVVARGALGVRVTW